MFIAFEGIDGSGKSTQAKLLAEHLAAAGYKVYLTFEPTDSEMGKLIRKIFSGERPADEHVIAALFAADRLDHILNTTNGIKKKLEEGYIVICDRYYLSSYAYHSVHVDMDWVIQLNSVSAQLLKPDFYFFIDVDVETSMQRIAASRTSTELYETSDNLRKVRENYFKAMEKLHSNENIIIINGKQEVDIITEEIWNNIALKL
ncbi:MAG TPA: dTMP kinase [Chitinophagales bacterium]|nr:dTMP kinase [Chitinophagales bacterium]